MTRVESYDGVKVVLMTDPGSGNHLSPKMISALSGAILCDEQPCVLMGSKEVFSVGRLKRGGHPFNAEDAKNFLDRLGKRNPPCGMAVEGAVVGWGLALMLAGTPRVGTSTAFFSLGIWEESDPREMQPVLQVLRSTVGHERAAMLAYTGRSLEAKAALKFGLLTREVPTSQLRRVSLSTAKT